MTRRKRSLNSRRFSSTSQHSRNVSPSSGSHTRLALASPGSGRKSKFCFSVFPAGAASDFDAEIISPRFSAAIRSAPSAPKGGASAFAWRFAVPRSAAPSGSGTNRLESEINSPPAVLCATNTESKTSTPSTICSHATVRWPNSFV